MSFILFHWMQQANRFGGRQEEVRDDAIKETPSGYVEGPEGVLMKKEEWDRIFGDKK